VGAALRCARCRSFRTLFYVRKKSTPFCCSWVSVSGNTAILSVGGSGIRKRGVYVFLSGVKQWDAEGVPPILTFWRKAPQESQAPPGPGVLVSSRQKSVKRVFLGARASRPQSAGRAELGVVVRARRPRSQGVSRSFSGSEAKPKVHTLHAGMLGFAALTPSYAGWVWPPSVREVSRGFCRVTEGVGAENGRGMRFAGFVTAATPSDSPSASHLPQEEGFGLRRFASEQWYAGGTLALQCGGARCFVGVRCAYPNLCALGFASLGEGGVARRSRVTEGVGAESGRGIRLAVFITAETPSDSPSASHLPQEEGLVLRRFASE
jgi:hypothetical protein